MLQGSGTATTTLPLSPLPADATEPTLSILLPVDADLREPPLAAIPLLCFLYDVPEGWDAVGWQHSNGSLVTAASMDERGVLSAWSLAWLTAERWGGAVGCTATQSSTGRSISVTTSPPSSTGQLPLLCSIPCMRGYNFGYRLGQFCSALAGSGGARLQQIRAPNASHPIASALQSVAKSTQRRMRGGH